MPEHTVETILVRRRTPDGEWLPVEKATVNVYRVRRPPRWNKTAINESEAVIQHNGSCVAGHIEENEALPIFTQLNPMTVGEVYLQHAFEIELWSIPSYADWAGIEVTEPREDLM